MKQHLLAFGTGALDASAGLVTVPVVNDGLIRASSNIVQLNESWDVLASYVGGVNVSRCRINSAGSRIRGYPNLHPINNSTLFGDNPIENDMRQSPIRLNQGENVTVQMTNAALVVVDVGLILAEPGGMFQPVPSHARKVRFTASPTSIAWGWSGAYNVVLDDDLEAGDYDVYGMSCYEATIALARLIFKNQVERPGCVCQQTAVQRPSRLQFGGTGKWGTFNSITPPFIEVYANAAAAISVVGYLLIAKAR